MRIQDLLVEQRLDEKPMGLLKTLGNKAASALGSDKATGRLESGELANQLRKEYDIWIGKTGDPVNIDSVKEFLKSQGLPTAAAEKAAGQPVAPGMVDKAVGAVKDVAKAGVQGAKDAVADKPAAQPNQKVEPTLAKPDAAPQPQATGADKPAANAQPQATDAKPNFTQGNYKVTTNAPTGGIPTTGLRPKLEPADKEKALPAGGKDQDNFNPDTGEPTTQYGQQKKSQRDLKAQLQAGKGLAKTSGTGFKQGMVKGNMRLGAGRGGVSMSHVPSGNFIAENFSGKQLDAIFLAAAQEASKLGVKPNTKVSLSKAAGIGYEQGKANMSGIISGSGQAQDSEETDSASSPLLQKYLSSAGRAGKDIVAEIPENIMKQLLKLKQNQKQTLLKALG